MLHAMVTPSCASVAVSHTMSRDFPLHRYMLDTFVEAVGRSEVKNRNLKGVTRKSISQECPP